MCPDLLSCQGLIQSRLSARCRTRWPIRARICAPLAVATIRRAGVSGSCGGTNDKGIVPAEGWALQTPDQPAFQDVLPDDPFYGYVETAYAHNAITGYSCGTQCLEFRPTNSATRVQICTILYNAMYVPR